MAASTLVPDSLLEAFFTQVCDRLDTCHNEAVSNKSGSNAHNEQLSLDALRKHVLTVQLECVAAVVEEYNNNNNNNNNKNTIAANDLQARIRSLNDADRWTPFRQRLDAAARKALCRCVLLQQKQKSCNNDDNNNNNYMSLRESIWQYRASGEIPAAHWLEWLGLLQTALQLEHMPEYLQGRRATYWEMNNHNLGLDHYSEYKDETDALLGSSSPSSSPRSPRKRMEELQRLFFRALNYDPDFGMAEHKRLFFSSTTSTEQAEMIIDIINNNNNNSDMDPQVQREFTNLVQATQQLWSSTPVQFSDHDEGGCTRVVAIHHSELDPATGHAVATQNTNQAPRSQSMVDSNSNSNDKPNNDNSAHERAQLQVAAQAAALENQLWQEILANPNREALLDRARATAERFVAEISSLPAGPERVQFLQSMDAATQKQLALHKLWESRKHRHHNHNHHHSEATTATTTYNRKK